MPAMALAALRRTARLMRFSPAMSVTEYIMAMSLTPTNGADVARGERRDHELRHADRQRAHAGGDDRRAAAAADADDAADVVAAWR